MIISPYNRWVLILGGVVLLVVFSFIGLDTVEAEAGASASNPLLSQTDVSPPVSGRTVDRIHIVADQLTADNALNLAEFTGNVVATQGNTVIKANQLKIFYKDMSENQQNMIGGEESIEKIIAYGNVIIQLENMLAETEEAVYMTDTSVLVLTGSGSKITRGENSVEGEKITIHRNEGHITVERGTGKRVEAVIFSGGKGIE